MLGAGQVLAITIIAIPGVGFPGKDLLVSWSPIPPAKPAKIGPEHPTPRLERGTKSDVL